MSSENALAVWDFTLGTKFMRQEALVEWLQKNCKKWAFQQEKGEKTGYDHFQGRVSLIKKDRMPIKPVPEISWSPTSLKNRDNEFYVLKENTRVDGPWTDRNMRYIPRQVRNIELWPWQQQIADDTTFDTRHINLVIDKQGCKGKSTLATYLGSRNKARQIPIMESFKDIMRMVLCMPKSNLYLIDFPRALNKNGSSFWGAIEKVKDGYAYDDRYAFKEEYFDCPNIWVFTNNVPDLDHMTRGRWKFWVIVDKHLIRADENGCPIENLPTG